MKIIVASEEVREVTRVNGNEELEGKAVIKLGPLDVVYSRLTPKKNPSLQDSFSLVARVPKKDAEELHSILSASVKKLAKEAGMKLTDGAIKKLVDKKLKDYETPDGEVDPNFKKLSLDQKMAFQGSDEIVKTSIIVTGPDNEVLDKVFLADGSKALANFEMVLKLGQNDRPVLPFRLKEVKITELVEWEGADDGGPQEPDGFDEFEGGY